MNRLDYYAPFLSFAQSKFGDLKDDSGTLIFDHNVRVFLTLFELFTKDGQEITDTKRDILLGGLFHDLLEDTKTQESEIESKTNATVLHYVKNMTISFNFVFLHRR